MDDMAVQAKGWSGPDLRVKSAEGWGKGLTLDSTALRWTVRGRDLDLPLDHIAEVALELYEDTGVTAMCNITTTGGQAMLVTNAGDLDRHRTEYRDFFFALVAALGPERCAAIRFSAGRSAARKRRAVSVAISFGMAAALFLILFLLFPQTPVFGGGWWIGVMFLSGGTLMMLLIALVEYRKQPTLFTADAVPEDALPRPR